MAFMKLRSVAPSRKANDYLVALLRPDQVEGLWLLLSTDEVAVL